MNDDVTRHAGRTRGPGRSCRTLGNRRRRRSGSLNGRRSARNAGRCRARCCSRGRRRHAASAARRASTRSDDDGRETHDDRVGPVRHYVSMMPLRVPAGSRLFACLALRAATDERQGQHRQLHPSQQIRSADAPPHRQEGRPIPERASESHRSSPALGRSRWWIVLSSGLLSIGCL